MKVYFDQKLIKKEYISFLAPLLGVPDFSIWREDSKQIEDRSMFGKNLLLSSTKDDCSYFVYPKYFVLEYSKELKEFSNEAKKCGKKVIVFYYGEIDDYINMDDNIIWYKRSTNKSNANSEICLPPFPEDLLKDSDKISYIHDTNQSKYLIGYTGYSNYTNSISYLHYVFVRLIGFMCRTKISKKFLMFFKKEDLYATLVNAGIGNYCRGEVIKYLKKTKKYKFNFIQRDHALTIKTKQRMREEYINNLIESDFALLVRGFGNYSVRQYEVMSLGKIPIYIDTYAKLPFQDEIEYNELFIIIPFKHIDRIEFYIDNYIEKNKGKLVEIQKKIRNTYEEYFIMKNYYSKIISSLESK